MRNVRFIANNSDSYVAILSNFIEVLKSVIQSMVITSCRQAQKLCQSIYFVREIIQAVTFQIGVVLGSCRLYWQVLKGLNIIPV